MATKAGPSLLAVVTIVTVLLLAGCGTWWQQRLGTRQREHQRCLQQRGRIALVMQQLAADQQALSTLAAERYIPSQKPTAPDPALAERFSQLDRDIDQERYKQQLEAWQRRESAARDRWQQTHAERVSRVEGRLAQHTRSLAELNSALITGGKPDPVAIRRLSDCSRTAP